MTKYLIAAVAALLLALGVSGWFHLEQAKATGKLAQQLSQSRAETKAVRTAAKRADAAVLSARRAQAAAEDAARATRATVEAALQAEPEWAAAPVPQPILDAINAPSPAPAPDGLRHNDDPEPAPGSPAGAVPEPARIDQDER